AEALPLGYGPCTEPVHAVTQRAVGSSPNAETTTRTSNNRRIINTILFAPPTWIYSATLKKYMEVNFTPDQQALVSDAIASGRLHRPEEAIQQALLLWEERERRRIEILAAVEQAEASLARGEGRRVTSREETTQLAEDIKRRGIARLSAEQNRR